MTVQPAIKKKPESLGLALRQEDLRYEAVNHKAPIQKPVVGFFIVYENDLHRDRAQRLQTELIQRLGSSYDFSVSWWKLKTLLHPKMLRLAAAAAARAQIILFALPSGMELPPSVKNWLEKGLINNPKQEVSLLALLETGGIVAPRLSSVEIYLRSLSSKAGVDSLCYSDGMPAVRFTRHCKRNGSDLHSNNRTANLSSLRKNPPRADSGNKIIKLFLIPP